MISVLWSGGVYFQDWIPDSYFVHCAISNCGIIDVLISSGLIPRPLGRKLVENQQLEESI